MFFKSDSLHPYCKNACEPVTMCGEVRVPEEHLEVMTSLCEYFSMAVLEFLGGHLKKSENLRFAVFAMPSVRIVGWRAAQVQVP